MKYRVAGPVWNRTDVYQVVAFAAHLGTKAAAIVDFDRSDAVRPSLGFGASPDETIWVEHLPWPIQRDLAPEAAEEVFLDRVEGWLARRALLDHEPSAA